MKKILSIIVLVFLWINTGFAQSLKPLQTYINENEKTIEDPIVVSYILKRCGAVYIFASAVHKDVSVDQAKIFKEASNEALLNAGKILMNKLNWSEDEVGQNIKTDLTKMVKYYKEDGSDFFARTGIYFEGNYIGDDLLICKRMIEIFR